MCTPIEKEVCTDVTEQECRQNILMMMMVVKMVMIKLKIFYSLRK